jgi:hypothetical protein
MYMFEEAFRDVWRAKFSMSSRGGVGLVLTAIILTTMDYAVSRARKGRRDEEADVSSVSLVPTRIRNGLNVCHAALDGTAIVGCHAFDVQLASSPTVIVGPRVASAAFCLVTICSVTMDQLAILAPMALSQPTKPAVSRARLVLPAQPAHAAGAQTDRSPVLLPPVATLVQLVRPESVVFARSVLMEESQTKRLHFASSAAMALRGRAVPVARAAQGISQTQQRQRASAAPLLVLPRTQMRVSNAWTVLPETSRTWNERPAELRYMH